MAHRVFLQLLRGLEYEQVERLERLLVILHPILPQVQILVLIPDVLELFLRGLLVVFAAQGRAHLLPGHFVGLRLLSGLSELVLDTGCVKESNLVRLEDEADQIFCLGQDLPVEVCSVYLAINNGVCHVRARLLLEPRVNTKR